MLKFTIDSTIEDLSGISSYLFVCLLIAFYTCSGQSYVASLVLFRVISGLYGQS